MLYSTPPRQSDCRRKRHTRQLHRKEEDKTNNDLSLESPMAIGGVDNAFMLQLSDVMKAVKKPKKHGKKNDGSDASLRRDAYPPVPREIRYDNVVPLITDRTNNDLPSVQSDEASKKVDIEHTNDVGVDTHQTTSAEVGKKRQSYILQPTFFGNIESWMAIPQESVQTRDDPIRNIIGGIGREESLGLVQPLSPPSGSTSISDSLQITRVNNEPSNMELGTYGGIKQSVISSCWERRLGMGVDTFLAVLCTLCSFSFVSTSALMRYPARDGIYTMVDGLAALGSISLLNAAFGCGYSSAVFCLLHSGICSILCCLGIGPTSLQLITMLSGNKSGHGPSIEFIAIYAFMLVRGLAQLALNLTRFIRTMDIIAKPRMNNAERIARAEELCTIRFQMPNAIAWLHALMAMVVAFSIVMDGGCTRRPWMSVSLAAHMLVPIFTWYTFIWGYDTVKETIRQHHHGSWCRWCTRGNKRFAASRVVRWSSMAFLCFVTLLFFASGIVIPAVSLGIRFWIPITTAPDNWVVSTFDTVACSRMRKYRKNAISDCSMPSFRTLVAMVSVITLCIVSIILLKRRLSATRRSCQKR